MVLPPGAAVDLEEVVVGAERERYGPEEVTRIETGTDSLWVRLPVPVTEEEGFVALQFSGVLYLASNAFAVQIGLGEGDERVWQRVDSGAGRSLQVLTPLSGGLLGEVVASSNPFTPNGDGINDVVELVFPVFAVQGSQGVGARGVWLRRPTRAADGPGGGTCRRSAAFDLGRAGRSGSPDAAGPVSVSGRREGRCRRRANDDYQTRR